MPQNNFSIGKDISLDVVDPVQGVVRFDIKTAFESKPQYHDIASTGLDGLTRYAELPTGWDGSFTMDRSNSAVDDYFAAFEANYFAGVNALPITITETINEADGSISQYRYDGVVLKLEEAGSWKGDERTTQRVSFKASRRIKVA